MTNILVADDAVDAAETLAFLFDSLGHEAHTAFDGQQAIVAAQQYAPHIIFLDLDMPVVDGYGAAQAIRSARRVDPPFIVALTGQSGPEIRRQIDAAGFDYYLCKPADTKALLALVDDLGQREHGALQP